MELEEAKRILKNMDIDWAGVTMCKECAYEDDKHRCFDDINGDCQMIAIKTVLSALDNSVSKDEIKEILRKYEYDENYTKQEFYIELRELLNKGE